MAAPADSKNDAGRGEQLSLSILGREYRVACAPSERTELLACAKYVDQKMQSIQGSGKVMGADRIAVLAALQIAQELFNVKGGDGLAVGELRRRLRELNALADEMLAPQEKLFP
jgi:cell division protein ZapA